MTPYKLKEAIIFAKVIQTPRESNLGSSFFRFSNSFQIRADDGTKSWEPGEKIL